MAVDGRQQVNVALNRPSHQSSIYSDTNGIYYAMYANDGRNGTDLLDGPCAHTWLDTNPWWSVDLLVPLYVAGVSFTNRDAAGRLRTSADVIN